MTMIKTGKNQNLLKRSCICCIFSFCVSGCVRLMVLIKRTEIKPEQTDNSKTAAKGEFSWNMMIVRIKLVSAKPIAERNKLLAITVHKLAAINAKRINIT